MRKILHTIIVSLLFIPFGMNSQTTADYQKVGWMTTRMYGGNRSGNGPNWLIMNHGKKTDFVKDADGAYDLTGGWHDCGDHVKFGQTQFYSGYMLLLGYSSFPEGYDDYYSPDYSGYSSSGDFSWEGKKGIPNGIPDILDEVKYGCDYFIKCTRDASTFYSQVGNGNYDHKNWVTSANMATLANDQGGESGGTRVIKKNPNDGSMVSFAGAALALMYRVYKHFDPTYANTCLQHAQYAYTYAKAHQTNAGGGTIEGAFYGADKDWRDNYVCLCAELYWATGTESYKTEALSYAADIGDHGWVLDYENSNDLAAYALAKLGSASGVSTLNTICARYIASVNANGCITVGSSANWGPLRYSANGAFTLALRQALNKETTINTSLEGTIKYIMGFNSSSQSFIVGFGSKSPKKPHHRNVFLSDANNMASVSIPSRNAQHGYMVGGTLNPGSFPDNISDYKSSEGGIDYNAGLVGALGYILSIKAPVDQSKFGLNNCSSPSLGNDMSLCGTTQVTLNANLSATGRIFSWTRNGTAITGTSPTLIATQAGTYEVSADSSGCVTKDQIVVSATIPAVNLGADKSYTGTAILLNTGVSGSSLTFAWSKDGTTINGASSSTYSVTATGTYSVTVSGTSCTSQSDAVVISAPPSFTYVSSAPTIDGTRDVKYVNSYPVSTLLVGTPNAADLSATWSGVWDNTYVYLHIAITDNALYNDSGTAWYEDDGVEVFFDGGNNKATTYDANDFQLGFVYGRTAPLAGSNNPSTVANVTQSIVVATGGYNVEILIPWASINHASPAIGQILGFDLGINDDDNGTSRENKISWHQAEDQGWQNPSVFGEISLLGETVTNLLPIANAGTDITITLPTNSTTLTGTVTSGDAPFVYSWSYISGPSTPTVVAGTTLTASVSNMIEGTYVFEFKATDKDGDISTDRVSIVVNPQPATTQTIALTTGWNLISLYVVPANTSITSVFSAILTSVNTIKTSETFYINGQIAALQSLQTIEAGKAYLVKMNSNATLTVTGALATAGSVQLKAGWNLLGYPLNSNSAISTKTASLGTNLKTIKNFSGFYEQGGLNSITQFVPGQGYFIKVTNAGTVTW